VKKIEVRKCRTCHYYVKAVKGCRSGWCSDHKEWVESNRIGCIPNYIKKSEEFIKKEEMEI
jgi:hypothetical protein